MSRASPRPSPRRCIDYRTNFGGFQNTRELVDILGMSEADLRHRASLPHPVIDASHGARRWRIPALVVAARSPRCGAVVWRRRSRCSESSPSRSALPCLGLARARSAPGRARDRARRCAPAGGRPGRASRRSTCTGAARALPLAGQTVIDHRSRRRRQPARRRRRRGAGRADQIADRRRRRSPASATSWCAGAVRPRPASATRSRPRASSTLPRDLPTFDRRAYLAQRHVVPRAPGDQLRRARPGAGLAGLPALAALALHRRARRRAPGAARRRAARHRPRRPPGHPGQPPERARSRPASSTCWCSAASRSRSSRASCRARCGRSSAGTPPGPPSP